MLIGPDMLRDNSRSFNDAVMTAVFADQRAKKKREKSVVVTVLQVRFYNTLALNWYPLVLESYSS